MPGIQNVNFSNKNVSLTRGTFEQLKLKLSLWEISKKILCLGQSKCCSDTVVLFIGQNTTNIATKIPLFEMILTETIQETCHGWPHQAVMQLVQYRFIFFPDFFKKRTKYLAATRLRIKTVYELYRNWVLKIRKFNIHYLIPPTKYYRITP